MNTNGPLQIVWKREDGDVILQAEYISFLDAWKVKLLREDKHGIYQKEIPVTQMELALWCIAVSARATKTMEECGHE